MVDENGRGEYVRALENTDTPAFGNGEPSLSSSSGKSRGTYGGSERRRLGTCRRLGA